MLGEGPLMAFQIRDSVNPIAPEHFFRFHQDHGTGCLGMFEMGIDIVHVNKQWLVNSTEVPGTLHLAFRTGGSHQYNSIFQSHFRMHDTTVLAGLAEALTQTKCPA